MSRFEAQNGEMFDSLSDAANVVPSWPTPVFTPINHQEPTVDGTTLSAEGGHVQMPTDPEGSMNTCRKRPAPDEKSSEKRIRASADNPRPIPTKQPPVGSVTLHAERTDRLGPDVPLTQYLIQRSESSLGSPVLVLPTSYKSWHGQPLDMDTHGSSAAENMESQAVVTPWMATEMFEVNGGYGPILALESSNTLYDEANGHYPMVHYAINGEGTHDDEYPLDDDIADDNIIQLLADNTGSVQEYHIPPSSVQKWHCGSRSPVEYDPTLQYTPPNQRQPDSSITERGTVSPANQIVGPDDLLDEEVDWSAVLLEVSAMQHNPLVDSRDTDASRPKGTGVVRHAPKAIHVEPGDSTPLKPYVRPPFPEKVRDRPEVPGLSSDTILRTCFRVGMMVEQTARCFCHRQDVIFQLYARVTYSHRENQIRKQHFQFVDLFKDQNPYPSATLSSWSVGSQLDRDSASFLDTSKGPRLCWCMCKPMRDPKTVIGYTYTVLKIREVDWDEIRWAKDIVCGVFEEQDPER
ncbi:hypothetical protein GGS20DRAFT_213622 [Poronia punctata]|nr:hypothetical protein GGS20DRAFT_213622 [Poronia punctata]